MTLHHLHPGTTIRDEEQRHTGDKGSETRDTRLPVTEPPSTPGFYPEEVESNAAVAAAAKTSPNRLTATPGERNILSRPRHYRTILGSLSGGARLLPCSSRLRLRLLDFVRGGHARGRRWSGPPCWVFRRAVAAAPATVEAVAIGVREGTVLEKTCVVAESGKDGDEAFKDVSVFGKVRGQSRGRGRGRGRWGDSRAIPNEREALEKQKTRAVQLVYGVG